MNRVRGTVVRWVDDKGFGFIRPDGGGKDVFVHVRDFGRSARTPEVGDVVLYQPANDGTGRFRAADVSIEGVAQARSSSAAGARAAPERHLSVGYGSTIGVILFCAGLGALFVAGYLPGAVVFVYVLISAGTFLAYAFDKSAAMTGRWRTSEQTLHVMGLLGGWPGALIAQQLFRHKSKKRDFRLVFWATVGLNLAALVWAASPWGRRLLHTVLG